MFINIEFPVTRISIYDCRVLKASRAFCGGSYGNSGNKKTNIAIMYLPVVQQTKQTGSRQQLAFF